MFFCRIFGMILVFQLNFRSLNQQILLPLRQRLTLKSIVSSFLDNLPEAEVDILLFSGRVLTNMRSVQVYDLIFSGTQRKKDVFLQLQLEAVQNWHYFGSM